LLRSSAKLLAGRTAWSSSRNFRSFMRSVRWAKRGWWPWRRRPPKWPARRQLRRASCRFR